MRPYIASSLAQTLRPPESDGGDSVRTRPKTASCTIEFEASLGDDEYSLRVKVIIGLFLATARGTSIEPSPKECLSRDDHILRVCYVLLM